jgi:hypothetical protein
MKRNRIVIPSGTLTNEEVETLIGKLAMCGYTVKKGKVSTGELKGTKYIEYWIDQED